jgi:hypothetical protein
MTGKTRISPIFLCGVGRIPEERKYYGCYGIHSGITMPDVKAFISNSYQKPPINGMGQY